MVGQIELDRYIQKPPALYAAAQIPNDALMTHSGHDPPAVPPGQASQQCWQHAGHSHLRRVSFRMRAIPTTRGKHREMPHAVAAPNEPSLGTRTAHSATLIA